MAGPWIATDEDGLGRLAILWDAFYKAPNAKTLPEIRLQESRFGLSPMDRVALATGQARRPDDAGSGASADQACGCRRSAPLADVAECLACSRRPLKGYLERWDRPTDTRSGRRRRSDLTS
jgi:hypothetical protein